MKKYKNILIEGFTLTEMLAFSQSASGRGTYMVENVRYIRITNLDDTNSVSVHIEDTSNTKYAQFLIPAGHVFLLTDVASSFGSATAAEIPTGDIERIDASNEVNLDEAELLINVKDKTIKEISFF